MLNKPYWIGFAVVLLVALALLNLPEQASQRVRLAVSGPDLFAEDYEGDLYAAIDLAAKKIEQQIRKRHNKFKARKQSEGAKVKRKRQDDTL